MVFFPLFSNNNFSPLQSGNNQNNNKDNNKKTYEIKIDMKNKTNNNIYIAIQNR